MELWIARDSNGELWVYDHTPIKNADIFQSNFDLEESRCFELPEWLLPEVTFRNSPQKVELKLVKEEAR